MLDTLFMDGLQADLERANRINSLLERTGAVHLDDPVADLRKLETLVILPTLDIRQAAAHHADELPFGVRLLMKGLGGSTRDSRQLISYLLFESGFTRELIDMGYDDGRARRNELEAFLNE